MNDFVVMIGFFLLTLVVPVLVGFFMGRYCPLVVRVVVVGPALYYGYLMVARSGRCFGQLCLLRIPGTPYLFLC